MRYMTMRTFSSSTTWTAPAGVTQVLISVGRSSPGGGTNTGFASQVIPVTPNTTYTITIGAGNTLNPSKHYKESRK